MFASDELRESADAGRRVSGLGRSNSCYSAADNSENSKERTGPDLHLRKQMEQVTTVFWKLAAAAATGDIRFSFRS
jgi:hypothetical protein